jgi:hypothetical protein
LIPCRLWAAVVIWILVIGLAIFFQPIFPSFIALLKNYVWAYAAIAVSAFALGLLTLNELTSVILEIGEQETWLRRSLFGNIYWKAQFPTRELNGVAPKWSMIGKRSSNFISWLLWVGSEHNEDNSMKSNVILYLRNTEYTLAISRLRPTEVNWLIDVIEEFLYQLHQSR